LEAFPDEGKMMGTASRETPTPAPLLKPRRWLYVILGVAVAVVVVGSVLNYEYEPGGPMNPYKVHVTEIIWLLVATIVLVQPGFTSNAGSTVYVSIPEPCSPLYGAPTNCTSALIDILTPGFGLVATNTPLTWSSGTTGKTVTLYAYVSLPPTNYLGNLTIGLVV
jgi:hypothetical protein